MDVRLIQAADDDPKEREAWSRGPEQISSPVCVLRPASRPSLLIDMAGKHEEVLATRAHYCASR
jgi:hypothetical protein